MLSVAKKTNNTRWRPHHHLFSANAETYRYVHCRQDINLGNDTPLSSTFTFNKSVCGAKYLMVATLEARTFTTKHRLRRRILENGSPAAWDHHSLTNEKFRSFAALRPRQEMNLTLNCNLMHRRNPCTGTKLRTYCGWRISHHQTCVGRNLNI